MKPITIISLGLAAGVLGSAIGRKTAKKSMLPFASYDPQSGCDPTPKPGVIAFRNYVLGRFGGGDGGISRECHLGGQSEHKEGRAWDWMVYGYADVDGFREWLFADDGKVLRDAGIMYAIFDGKIWKGYAGGLDSWYDYHGDNPHADHWHLSFSWEGARGELPWYQEQKR